MLRNMCLLVFHPAICDKILKLFNAASANVMSLFITLQAPDDLDFLKVLCTFAISGLVLPD